MKIVSKIILAVLTLICFNAVHADYATAQTGRYMTNTIQPNPQQVHLLSQAIQVRFPQNVQTVGDAMRYLLRLSGYDLVSTEHMSGALQTTLLKPLPVIDRELGPTTLRDGLTTLAGPVFDLIQDPVNREVNFRLKEEYRKIYLSNKQNGKRG